MRRADYAWDLVLMRQVKLGPKVVSMAVLVCWRLQWQCWVIGADLIEQM